MTAGFTHGLRNRRARVADAFALSEPRPLVSSHDRPISPAYGTRRGRPLPLGRSLLIGRHRRFDRRTVERWLLELRHHAVMHVLSPLNAAADFAEGHRPLLREIADRFLEDGWPTRDELGRAALRRGDDVDVFAALRELPAPLGHVDHDGIVRLLVRGLAVAPSTEHVLHEFLRALRLAGLRLKGSDEHPKLRRGDLASSLGLDEPLATKVSHVLLNEAWMLGGGTGGPEDDWERDVTEHTRFVIDVGNIGDYLRIEGQHRWPSPISGLLEGFAGPGPGPSEEPHDDLATLHSVVAVAARPAWERADWSQALQDAWFALRDLVRQRLGEPNLDGTQLMERIGDNEPRLPLTPMATATDRDMHRGAWRFLVGVAMYVRNPQMHETESPVRQDRIGALERLAVMSLCARHVESAASPVAVADAVREVSQPLFPATEAAADDLIRTIPTGRRADLVDALIEAFLQTEDRALAQNLVYVVRRALGGDDSDAQAVALAAQRAGGLIADDTTLSRAIALLTPAVLHALAPRHREKVALVLADDARSGMIRRGTIFAGGYADATVRLFLALSDTQRSQVLGALQESLGAHWERQAYAMRIAAGVLGHLLLSEAGPLLAAMAGTIVRDNAWDAADELTTALPTVPTEQRTALLQELDARAEQGGPGAELAQRIVADAA